MNFVTPCGHSDRFGLFDLAALHFNASAAKVCLSASHALDFYETFILGKDK